jgi:hypothetical protein
VIGFVEDERLDFIERNAAALHMVEQASRRGHDDVRLALQRVELRLHLHAADHAGGVQLVMLAEDVQEGLGLQRDLARGREDQAADAAAVHEALGHRQRERRRLAGAGLREADHVAAGERDGDHRRLDGRRMLEADLVDGGEDLGAEAEGGERGIGRGDRMLRYRNCLHLSKNLHVNADVDDQHDGADRNLQPAGQPRGVDDGHDVLRNEPAVVAGPASRAEEVVLPPGERAPPPEELDEHAPDRRRQMHPRQPRPPQHEQPAEEDEQYER